MLDGGAIDGDQRARETLVRDRSDARQPGRTGAAQETEQHGFGLIGLCVAQGDAVRGARAQMIEKETAAFLARGLFQILTALARQPRYIRFAEREGQTERGRHLLDKAGILAGLFAAQSMVQMNHAQVKVPARGKLVEYMQKAGGIRAAGHRDRHALARLEHAITGDDFRHALEHEPILTS